MRVEVIGHTPEVTINGAKFLAGSSPRLQGAIGGAQYHVGGGAITVSDEPHAIPREAGSRGRSRSSDGQPTAREDFELFDQEGYAQRSPGTLVSREGGEMGQVQAIVLPPAPTSVAASVGDKDAEQLTCPVPRRRVRQGPVAVVSGPPACAAGQAEPRESRRFKWS